MYVFAVAAAIVIARGAGRGGGDPDLAYEAAMWGFPAGLIGGRIYFLITTPSQIPDHWWGPFAIWNGGLGIWGGIARGALVGLCVSAGGSVSHVRCSWTPPRPALLVAQAFGRIGNYFNQELFGKPSTLPWALKIAPAHRPPGYRSTRPSSRRSSTRSSGTCRSPAFLVWLGHHRKIRPPGLFALYVAGYSAFGSSRRRCGSTTRTTSSGCG